jgi:hypothetical protein
MQMCSKSVSNNFMSEHKSVCDISRRLFWRTHNLVCHAHGGVAHMPWALCYKVWFLYTHVLFLETLMQTSLPETANVLLNSTLSFRAVPGHVLWQIPAHTVIYYLIYDYVQSVEWLVYCLNDRGIRVQFPVRAMDFSILYRSITALKPILPPIELVPGPSSGSKADWAWSWVLPSSSVEINNAGSHTSALLYVFVTRFLIKHSEKYFYLWYTSKDLVRFFNLPDHWRGYLFMVLRPRYITDLFTVSISP